VQKFKSTNHRGACVLTVYLLECLKAKILHDFLRGVIYINCWVKTNCSEYLKELSADASAYMLSCCVLHVQCLNSSKTILQLKLIHSQKKIDDRDPPTLDRCRSTKRSVEHEPKLSCIRKYTMPTNEAFQLNSIYLRLLWMNKSCHIWTNFLTNFVCQAPYVSKLHTYI
jgi:hypothetical protein